jgi:GPH family glycoside/pentoside/hexuronide:cation symporter
MTLRKGMLYAAGDIGPSLTSLCLAFYWLYFLIEVAGIPTLHAGLIHGSGYVFSAAASLWAGGFLDRHVTGTKGRCRLIVLLGAGLAATFFLLWCAPSLGEWKMMWYLVLSWLFHLIFALVYLAYLSLTPALASTAADRVALNSYRFGGTMLLVLVILGLHSATESLWSMPQRLLALGGMVALLAAAGAIVCGAGLKRAITGDVVQKPEQAVAWGALLRSRVLWWAVGGNLSVWLMVQMASVLTIFLCKAAGIGDALILLVMQVCIVFAAGLTSVAASRWSEGRLIAACALLWCAGAGFWWHAVSPATAAILLGLALGAATVLSWARVPEAIDLFSRAGGGRADARAYAGLTVLRDGISALVPLVTSFALDGHAIGSMEAGQTASALLLVTALCSALALAALQLLRSLPLPAEDAEIAQAPR